MRAEQRREQVLACAAALFAEQGYHQTTVEHIVTRASIARGTFYLYFQDKRSIFQELLLTYMGDLRAHIVRVDPSLGPETCLRLVRDNLLGVLGVCLDRRDLTKILISQAVGLDEDFDRQLVDFYREVTDILERTLSLGQTLGLVSPGDVHIPAVCALGSLKELLYHVTMRDLPSTLDELVDGVLRCYRAGLIRV